MFHKVLDLIFPERCVLCGNIMKTPESGVAICRHCMKEVPFLDDLPTCRICGCRTDSFVPVCVTCQTHKHFFNRAVSCFSYEGAVRQSILQYKFGKRRDYCRTFSRLLYYRVLPFHKEEVFDCVVCAPMSKTDLITRGYHQTALLAKRIAKLLALPFWADAFCKVKETRKQSTLDYQERFKNVKDAFALALPKNHFKGKRILLIDDVLTTGATADALSRLLVSAGAAQITVATIAATHKEGSVPITAEDERLVTY